MPELPEVETMVRGVRGVAEGRRITRMEFCECSRQPIQVTPAAAQFSANVQNALITRIHRLAKRIVLDLQLPPGSSLISRSVATAVDAAGLTAGRTSRTRATCTRAAPTGAAPAGANLAAATTAGAADVPEDPESRKLHVVIEPRMTGLLLISEPPTMDHRRICWHLADEPAAGTSPVSSQASSRAQAPTTATEHGSGMRLEFWDRRGLGTVRLLTPSQLSALRETLGTDALSMQLRDWRKTFCSTSRAVKVALLDQTRIAGIGNLYASEILHAAGVIPQRAACDLTDAEWKRIHQATRRILKEAIRYEGSTLSDGTYRNALNKDGGYQNEHRVYQKADRPCRTCGHPSIVRIVQAQRSTFFCPGCQR